MKTVFPNREIPHKWAHATQEHARGSNLSFQGDTLYSYATPIAKIYCKPGSYPKGSNLPDPAALPQGCALVLMSERGYSSTTRKHLGYAYVAVSHLPVVTVPRYIIGAYSEGQYRGDTAAKDHAANLAYLESFAANELAKAKRALSLSPIRRRKDNALRAIRQAGEYMDFFGIRRKRPALPELEWNAAAARAERLENPDPASVDARERARARKVQAEYARRRLAEIDREIGLPDYRLMAQRSNWRLHGAFHTYGVSVRNGACMLRVNGEEIETSLGARVPLAAAPMVWNLVQRAKDQGGFEPSKGLGSRLTIGDYPLDRIDADGTLHAGCHEIPFSELAVMARSLGLSGAA